MTPNPNPSPELLPCPFCGGEASLTVPSELVIADCADIYVACDECESEGQHIVVEIRDRGNDIWPEDCAEARRAWNTRALTPPTPAETVTVALPGAGEVERLAKIFADASDYYVPFHRGLSSPSADKIHKGMTAVVAALAVQPRAAHGGKVEAILKTAQTDCGCRIPAPFDEVAEHAIGLALATVAAANDEGVDFRALLIEAGRNAGALLDDRVSDTFLKGIPEEVRLKIERLREDTRTIQRNTATYREEARAEADAANERAAEANKRADNMAEANRRLLAMFEADPTSLATSRSQHEGASS